mmetsp:Transcript_5586/g.14465  ORF Transcript_5586/g.14465 Transcript_5586/m.14465 type:complete len:202 (-) Transcript_5586:690-1295(-)
MQVEDRSAEEAGRQIAQAPRLAGLGERLLALKHLVVPDRLQNSLRGHEQVKLDGHRHIHGTLPLIRHYQVHGAAEDERHEILEEVLVHCPGVRGRAPREELALNRPHQAVLEILAEDKLLICRHHFILIRRPKVKRFRVSQKVVHAAAKPVEHEHELVLLEEAHPVGVDGGKEVLHFLLHAGGGVSLLGVPPGRVIFRHVL